MVSKVQAKIGTSGAQLMEYLKISDSFLQELDDEIMDKPRGRFADAICPAVIIRTPDTSLASRMCENVGMQRIVSQINEAEDELEVAQKPIKDKIHTQIIDVRESIDSLYSQAHVLSALEKYNKLRLDQVYVNKDEQKNLKSNEKKVVCHMRQEKKVDRKAIRNFRLGTEFQIAQFDQKNKEIRANAKKCHNKLIVPQQKRLKKQMGEVTTKVQELCAKLDELMLTPADQHTIYNICLKSIQALKASAINPNIKGDVLRVSVSIIKCVALICSSVLSGGVTIPATIATIAEVIETCCNILDSFKKDTTGAK